MIITFCGHADFYHEKQYRDFVLEFLEKRVGNNNADILLGGYGLFDEFAYSCAKEYKKTHQGISLCFVTPYPLTIENNKELEEKYDIILYPPIEAVPAKYAIVHRNRYMVDKADCVLCYITHSWGGAYKTYRYAKQRKKEVILINAPIYDI